MVALEIEKFEAGRAKERQGARNDIVEKIPQGDEGKARDKAAAAVGVNPRYVSDAKCVERLGFLPSLAAPLELHDELLYRAFGRVEPLGNDCPRRRLVRFNVGRLVFQSRQLGVVRLQLPVPIRKLLHSLFVPFCRRKLVKPGR